MTCSLCSAISRRKSENTSPQCSHSSGCALFVSSVIGKAILGEEQEPGFHPASCLRDGPIEGKLNDQRLGLHSLNHNAANNVVRLGMFLYL